MRPRAKESVASRGQDGCRRRMMVIIRMTVENTSAEMQAFEGRPTQTTVPRDLQIFTPGVNYLTLFSKGGVVAG